MSDSPIQRLELSLGDDLLQYVTGVEDMIVCQRLEFSFPNGYGASVVRGRIVLGAEFEIGLLKDGQLISVDHIVRMDGDTTARLLQALLALEPGNLDQLNLEDV